MYNISGMDLLSQKQIDLQIFQRNPLKLEDEKTQSSLPSKQNILISSLDNTNGSDLISNRGDDTTTVNSQSNPIEQSNNEIASDDKIKHSLHTIPESYVYYEALIVRKQKGLIQSWEKRYIVLTSAKLYFFQNQKKNHLLGCLNIKHLPIQIKAKQDSFLITFQDEGQTIELKGVNEIQNALLANKLNDVIQFRSNQKKIVIRKFNRSLYQQKDFTLEEEFLANAETGDLLLVSSENSASYLQKFLTHSEFNHVAMILKFQGQIKVFEANEDDGVFIYDWKHYLSIFKDHKRFAFRKLFHPKKQDLQPKIKQLAKKYIGRSYSLSSCKLLRRNSSNETLDQDRQFFCSQIVAKIYKQIGLLDQQISSVRYWPITFTSRGELNLFDGAHLSHQKNILLTKHLKI